MSAASNPSPSDSAFSQVPHMARRAPEVSLSDATAILVAEYGLNGTLARLTGERDQNFKVVVQNGASYALKLIHPEEDPSITDFQTKILLELAKRDPTLPVPSIVRTKQGHADTSVVLADGSSRMARLVTFMPGTIIRGLAANTTRSFEMGVILAKMQLALSDFSHPSDLHEIAWDIRRTEWQHVVVAEIESAERRSLMKAGLSRFAERAAGAMNALRSQVVHNDLSGDNVLVDAADTSRVVGVIDFGDAVRTPVINDVAVALSYALLDASTELEASLPFLRGFSSVKKLYPEEVDLLLDLVIARMVVRVGITEWRARRFPENRDYILRSTGIAWELLEKLLRLSPSAVRSQFAKACA